MKKISYLCVLSALLVSMTHAGLAPSKLPSSSYYQGRASRSYDLGSEGTLDIRLEFAVYQGSEAETMMEMTEYSGDLVGSDNAFVYAYQVFSESSSTAELEYFALTGVNPDSIASDTDISQIDEMTAPNSNVFDSEGVEPSPDGYFSNDKTKAIWEFSNTTIIEGEQSWFLFSYSGSDYIAGDIEIQPADDDIPIPGVPEPATLALLACGAVLSFKRRK